MTPYSNLPKTQSISIYINASETAVKFYVGEEPNKSRLCSFKITFKINVENHCKQLKGGK